MVMNIARLTGWTPYVIMWQISFPALMRMVASIGRDQKDQPGVMRGGSPESELMQAASMGMYTQDFTNANH